MTRVETLVLFLILEEMFQFFTIKNNVCSRFVVCGLYYVEVVFLYSHCLLFYFFNDKWVLNLSVLTDAFHTSIAITMCFVFSI